MFLWHCCYVAAALPCLLACMKPEQLGRASVLSVCEGLSLQEPRDLQARAAAWLHDPCRPR